MDTYIVSYSAMTTGDVRVDADTPDTAKAIATAWLTTHQPTLDITVRTPKRLTDIPEATD